MKSLLLAVHLSGEKPYTQMAQFSPDGQRLFSAWHDSTVTIWDATPLPEKP
jgi:hypothetical protein